MSDDQRPALVKKYHRKWKQDAEHYRHVRDVLIRQLKADGWTNTRLAALIGCTEGNIRHILKGDSK